MNELYTAIIDDLSKSLQDVLRLQSITNQNDGHSVANAAQQRAEQEQVVRRAKESLQNAQNACSVASYYKK